MCYRCLFSSVLVKPVGAEVLQHATRKKPPCLFFLYFCTVLDRDAVVTQGLLS